MTELLLLLALILRLRGVTNRLQLVEHPPDRQMLVIQVYPRRTQSRPFRRRLSSSSHGPVSVLLSFHQYQRCIIGRRQEHVRLEGHWMDDDGAA